MSVPVPRPTWRSFLFDGVKGALRHSRGPGPYMFVSHRLSSGRRVWPPSRSSGEFRGGTGDPQSSGAYPFFTRDFFLHRENLFFDPETGQTDESGARAGTWDTFWSLPYDPGTPTPSLDPCDDLWVRTDGLSDRLGETKSQRGRRVGRPDTTLSSFPLLYGQLFGGTCDCRAVELSTERRRRVP